MAPETKGRPSAVEVAALSVTRGHRQILRDVNFSIATGMITGLLGPSGSGKTTLMRTMVGVQKINYGTATVLDLPAGAPLLRHSVGYMTQDASVYPDLTVEANVRYFGTMAGSSRAQVREAVEAVGLAEFSKRKAVQLSGGQFSRVSLACALVAKPKLLILDEPTVGLDPVLRVDLWNRFARLAEEGTTLVVSSHVMEEASRCNSLLLLRDGALLAQLTPTELRRRAGTEDLELAFLRIIEQSEREDAA
ncbi:ABC transporter ATP-binding protein [Arthrobacter sp. H5]|uniref:ABC transporter ATP-binding protein n=1 Tax=Arthrobacter sp. H5 TaxID=1267973 RepID=UPI0004AEE2EB|nr:ABC transporter ATP-binding protein [Arthrobacter sp. H5]